MPLSSFTSLFPPQLRRFLVGGEEIKIESALESSVLLDRVRKSMDGLLDLADGASGYTTGSFIHVGWSSSWFRRDGFAPMFHGQVQSLGTGSVISGKFSGGYVGRAFLWLWTGGIVLFSLLFIWTLIFPLAGWAMLWMAEGMICMGETSPQDREQSILQHLKKLTEPTGNEPQA